MDHVQEKVEITILSNVRKVREKEVVYHIHEALRLRKKKLQTYFQLINCTSEPREESNSSIS